MWSYYDVAEALSLLQLSLLILAVLFVILINYLIVLFTDAKVMETKTSCCQLGDMAHQKKNKSQLLAAFNEGDVRKIQQIVSDLPNASIVTIPTIVKDLKSSNRQMSPLSVAIVHQNYDLSKRLVEEGISLMGTTEEFLRPLSVALQHRQTNIAELLISFGADVTLINNDKNTYPMFWAIRGNNPAVIIERIIAAGFPANGCVQRQVTLTAIQCAVFENNLEAAEVLIRHSVNLNVLFLGEDSLVCTAVKKNFPSMVKLLVKSGAVLENRLDKMSPLLIAIRFEYLTMVEVLLNLGADKAEGRVADEKVPPLQFAISYLNLDIIKLLIDKGADVRAKHKTSGETALHVAVSYIGFKYSGEQLQQLQAKVTKLLLEKEVDVNVKDCQGRTPLDGAIYSENTEVCKMLLREGADVVGHGKINIYPDAPQIITNRFEYIACMTAFKCPELIDLCLERGGDYYFRGRHGLVPYHCALAKHNPEMVKAYWRHGCPFDLPELIPGKMKSMLWYNPDKADRKLLSVQEKFIDGIKNNKLDTVVKALAEGAVARGCSVKMPSPIHFVAASNNHKIARVLLENGVAVNRVNDKGQCPLHVAVDKKQITVSQVFLSFGACFDCKTPKGKRLRESVKASRPIYEIFTNIYKAFRLTKQGDLQVLTLLRGFATHDEADLLTLAGLVNCVDRRGYTLTSLALHLGHVEIAQGLMKLRIEALE